MKVIQVNPSDELIERRDYRGLVEFKVSTNAESKELSFYDGEPEDANLSRDFSDVYSIPYLLKMAYDAGKSGETFESVVEIMEDY